jgi:5-methylcytosine-specific restriction endonuclease McrA
MAPVRGCIERLPDGRGCPRYAVPGRSRCAEHEAAHEAARRRDPSLTGRRGSTGEQRRARHVALQRDRYRCRQCGRTARELRRGEALEVHHVDGDARNNAPHNLRTLCTSCHRAASAALRIAAAHATRSRA